MNVEFSPRARIDMNEILEFVGGKNPQAAVRLLDRLEETCLSLPTMPGIGTRRDDLAREAPRVVAWKLRDLLCRSDRADIADRAHHARVTGCKASRFSPQCLGG